MHLFFVCSFIVLMTLLCSGLFLYVFCYFGWWIIVWHGFICGSPARLRFSVHFFRGIFVWFCPLLHTTILLIWDYLKLFYQFRISRTALIMQSPHPICLRENLCIWIPWEMCFIFYSEPKSRLRSSLLFHFVGEHIFLAYPFTEIIALQKCWFIERPQIRHSKALFSLPKRPFKHKLFGHQD